MAGDVVVPICEPVTIMELRELMCRWPIGDPTQSEFRYCGAEEIAGSRAVLLMPLLASPIKICMTAAANGPPHRHARG